jgi:hypothetical protein
MNYVASISSLTLDAAYLGLNCTSAHREPDHALPQHDRAQIPVGGIVHAPFWIDSDIAFQSEAVFRLLQADRDVVAGVYPNEAIQLASRGSARRE